MDAVEQCGTLDQFVARQREEATLGCAVDGMPRTAYPLQEGCDRARRTELTDQIDLADVDPELERGGRHQRLQLAVLETLLGVEPLFLGEAAVVRGYQIGAQALRQLAGHAFDQAARIDED